MIRLFKFLFLNWGKFHYFDFFFTLESYLRNFLTIKYPHRERNIIAKESVNENQSPVDDEIYFQIEKIYRIKDNKNIIA